MTKNSPPTINKSNNVFIISMRQSFNIVDFSNIICLKAENNYTSVYFHDDSSHMLCKTLKTFEDILPAKHFFRCHKSFIINLNYIDKIALRGAGNITLTNGKSIPVARRKVAMLRKILKLYFR